MAQASIQETGESFPAGSGEVLDQQRFSLLSRIGQSVSGRSLGTGIAIASGLGLVGHGLVNPNSGRAVTGFVDPGAIDCVTTPEGVKTGSAVVRSKFYGVGGIDEGNPQMVITSTSSTEVLEVFNGTLRDYLTGNPSRDVGPGQVVGQDFGDGYATQLFKPQVGEVRMEARFTATDDNGNPIDTVSTSTTVCNTGEQAPVAPDPATGTNPNESPTDQTSPEVCVAPTKLTATLARVGGKKSNRWVAKLTLVAEGEGTISKAGNRADKNLKKAKLAAGFTMRSSVGINTVNTNFLRREGAKRVIDQRTDLREGQPVKASVPFTTIKKGVLPKLSFGYNSPAGTVKCNSGSQRAPLSVVNARVVASR